MGPPEGHTPVKAKQLAALLGVSRRQVARWRRQAGFPCHQLGESVLYFTDEVVAWIRTRKGPKGGR